MANTIATFLTRYQIDPATQCWNWTRGKDWDGYGTFWFQNRQWRAPKFCFIFVKKEALAPRNLVCHTCDNPSCINPAHLFQATAKENAIDCSVKGRKRPRRGSQVSASKLTEALVERARALRKTGLTIRAIHEVLGKPLSYSNLAHAIAGNTWAHVRS